uniref:DUF148 domain-containing protein n=1 Tax=Steinernema glaseri TaxID=37863 RepID=A0A1I7Z6X0_9BILA
MAFKTTVYLLPLLVLAAFALPIPTHGDAKEFYDVLPAEVKQYITELTDADAKLLSEIYDQIKDKEDDEVYEIIQAKSPDLAERTRTLDATLQSKISQLSAAPQKFMKNLMGAIENFKENNVEQVLKQVDTLSPESKEEILNYFPSLKPILKV